MAETKRRKLPGTEEFERREVMAAQVSMVKTEGIPTMYVNLASLSMSYNDLRVYLMEASPKEVNVVSVGKGTKATEANVQPKLCLVLTPEFARALRDSLSSTIASYESAFGQLRNAPNNDALIKSLPKQ